MAIQTPSCNDSQWQLLFKILESLPDISTGGGGSNGTIQSGAQAIGSGIGNVAVIFPVAFASAPHVVCTVSRPAGGALIQVNVNSDQILTTGFGARLSALTPNATYILQWHAHV